MTPTQLRQSAQTVLEENILAYWLRLRDKERGGFYGQVTGDEVLVPDAPRGAVLNARILWSFASACRVLSHQRSAVSDQLSAYLKAAQEAKRYIEAHFIDREHGGCYWSVTAEGEALDTKKQTYAIAFTIYGLSEYARATDDKEALNAAIRLFRDIESHAFDAENIGYVEALTRDWQPIADMRLSEHDENGSRTMNTHLHVLEAYTSLLRVWRDSVLERQLRILISIFATRIYNEQTGHLGLFFDDTWQPIASRHNESPGHDIEAAWLLTEALEVLGDDALKAELMPIVRHIARASEDGIFAETQWWTYCEAVIGYVDQWQHLLDKRQKTKDKNRAEEYWQLVERAYAFITDKLIDREHGEWFWEILPDGTPNRKEDKAGFWKCPYHNSRMCYELIERLS
jgi:mannobiose 2-epimerase